MLTGRSTLTEYLIAERRRHREATGDLNGLILDLALACKTISKQVAAGDLAGALGSAGSANVKGEAQQRLDLLAEEIFRRTTQTRGRLAGAVSEESEGPLPLPTGVERGKYLLLFDPLDGSSNIDVNVSVGSIFSILRAPRPGEDAVLEDFLQPGSRQVCAGYAIYGPQTMLVLTVGSGVHGFTLDPLLGEFVLTHPALAVPAETREFAINASNSRFSEPAVRRYVNECLAGTAGVRSKDFNMRWIASLVAEAHRILIRGGVFLHPPDTREPARHGRLGLLYEANPIAFLIEQAGGAASTGRRRILELEPSSLHQRAGFVFGSREEVERILAYHHDASNVGPETPLFGERGLFRGAG